MKETKTIEKYFYVIIGLVLVLGALLVKDKIGETFSFILHMLKPLLAGGFISYLLHPLIKRLDILFGKFGKKSKVFSNNKANNVISITVTYVLAITIFGFLISLCAPSIGANIKELIEKAPVFYENISNYVDDSGVVEYLDKFIDADKLIADMSQQISGFIPAAISWAGGLLKSGTNLLVAIVISIYITIDLQNLKRNSIRFLMAYVKEKKTSKIIGIVRECDSIFHLFIVGKAIDSTIIGILTFIILKIFGIEYAVLLSLIVGITNMIPYVGPLIGGFIGAIILLVVSFNQALVYSIIILFIQQLDGHVIGPKILSGKIGIGPLWIILSVMIGGIIGGITGMFLGPPIIATTAHMLNKDIEGRLGKGQDT